MIELKNINIKYDNKECIRNGDFKAYPYQITGIYGESGTGKSSLLYILGMLSNQDYEYYYNDTLLNLEKKYRQEFRNKHISFITQNSLLIETISVEKNIEFFLLQSQEAYTVDTLLRLVNLENKKDAMPNSLSSGERQRIAIACALAKGSNIILGDELTSALDEENKKNIMSLLKECALQGKIVILVSHEKVILEQCDRLYKIDHLKLQIKKDKTENLEKTQSIYNMKKSRLWNTYKILFLSNKKINWRRFIFNLIIVLILFLSASVVTESYNNANWISYSLEDVSKKKVRIISDHSETYQDRKGISTQRDYVEEEPISDSIVNQIKKVNHIEKVYDYYVFRSHDRSGSTTVVKRNGKIRDKKEYINGYKYSVVPVYPEESIYTQDEGVYVSEFFAYIFNVKEGDILELELPVPYAMSRQIEASYNIPEKEEGVKYHSYSTITTSIAYEAKVLGIVSANAWEQKEIYMNYDIMEKIIEEQVQGYKNKEIIINKANYEDYSTIEDLQPYGKVAFVDEYENVLSVINDIHSISKKVLAYNEYMEVYNSMIEMEEISKDAFLMALIGVFVFIVGGFIIELLYLMKYKSVFISLKLIGYNHMHYIILNLLEVIHQIIIMTFISSFIYITASLPDILRALKIVTYEQLLSHMSELHNTYYAYCQFSFIHLSILGLLIFGVIIIGNVLLNGYYHRQNIIMWLRGE